MSTRLSLRSKRLTFFGGSARCFLRHRPVDGSEEKIITPRGRPHSGMSRPVRSSPERTFTIYRGDLVSLSIYLWLVVLRSTSPSAGTFPVHFAVCSSGHIQMRRASLFFRG